MPFTGPLEDRQAIQEVYGVCADASVRGDRDMWVNTYVDEGCEWNTHYFNCAGKPAISEQWDQLWLNFEKVGFISQIGSIEVDGARASVRATAQETIRLKDGNVYRLIGLYRDELVKQDGIWRFTVRNYEPLVEELPVTNMPE